MIMFGFGEACVFLFWMLAFEQVSSTNSNIAAHTLTQRKFPPCRACKIFTQSFERGIKSTEKGKYEGGDAAWEEEKLGSYATSEVRLVEIQEKVCSDVEEGRDQCYSFHEQYDSEIENWWFRHQITETSLFKYFCIDTLKLCCPDLHYGQNCTPCTGYPDNVCNNNGKCQGAGTRMGNGKCHCDPGYEGDYCDKCAKNHFAAYKDDNKLLCSKCHQSCESTCTAPGAIGCDKCAVGWLMDKQKGCLDINECAAPTSICNPLQFCVNTEGSYKCLECDRSCAGCIGDGPDMCINCAEGYILIDGMCTDAKQKTLNNQMLITRYLTYLGLCFATCIVFQRSVVLAAVLGLLIAVYISTSEYMLNKASPSSIDMVQFMKKA